MIQNDDIKWSPNTVLQWKDFKGKPKKRESVAASISTGFKFSWTSKSKGEINDFSYTLYAFMSPQKSWVLPSKKTDHILKHERLHFDITAFVTFRFREALNAYKPTRDIKEELSNLYDEFFILRNKIQSQYDRETNHGINTEAQKQWALKVEKLLQPYLK